MFRLRCKSVVDTDNLQPAPLSNESSVRLPFMSYLGQHRNVRELEHWVESAIVLAADGRVTREMWPRSRSAPGHDPVDARGETLAVGLTLEEATRRYVAATVEACGGNKTEAARQLAVGRNTIARALRRKS